MFRASNFDKLLDKATSNLRLDPDWPTIIQICDLIRQNDCSPKYAIAALKKKLYSPNPHQAMFALLTLESIVKNCGAGIHEEVASKVFCEMLRDLVKTTPHENLKTKILDLVQAWAFAFRNTPKYRTVQDTVNILKAEGYKFPPLKESDAMFSADTAPEWADGEVCHRCRVQFTLMVRRHHCRACGQVFCQQCSSKTSTLPKFGIEKEVRVCDACYDKVSRPPSSTAKIEIADTTSDYGPAQPQKKPGKSAEELQEEEELQLALALSQSEAEHKEKERGRVSRSHIAPDPPHGPTISPTASSVSASPEHSTTANSELSRYLDRNYWEQRRDAGASAPAATPAPSSVGTSEPEYVKPATSKSQKDEDDAEDKEIDEFVETLKSQVEIFVNRMKSNSSRGRSIANDTSVQTLFMNITAMHSRLLRYIQQQDDKRVYLESLQDKVNQVRDSRAALDTLRAEHQARLAAAAEQADRQRQMQMAAKLHAMRKKKHEYLQYQRQLALQRVQEQEREMQMRQEQQKYQYMMNNRNVANNAFFMPGVSMNQFQQPQYPNQPLYAHPQMIAQTTESMTQPQISQPIGVTQMGTISQSMPQLTNTFAMSPSGMTLTQAPTNQASINQPNNRPMGQQLPMQQQLIMQQMHQMQRMPVQPGVHQLVQPNQQNGQTLPKQALQNQPSNIMPPISSAQQNIPPALLNQANPMMGMQMQNMRMPMMQGQNQQPGQMIGYPLNMPNQPNNQMPMPGQPMPMQNQQIMQNQAIPGQLPNNNQPQPQQGQAQGQQNQMQQGQPIQMQGQNMPGQPMQNPQMMMQQQMLSQGQNIPQQKSSINHHQQNQMPQMAPGQMMQGQNPQNMQNLHNQQMQSLPHNPQMQGLQQNPQMQGVPQNPQMQGLPQNPQIQGLPQNPQMQGIPQNNQMQNLPQNPQMQGQSTQLPAQIPQGTQMPGQIPQGTQVSSQMPQMQMQMPQGQMQGPGQMPQQMKPPQNFGNEPPSQPPPTNPQQPDPNVKSEHNNNTAELISFD